MSGLLLLEDDAGVVSTVRAEISASFDIVVATNYTEALDHLYRTPNLVAVVAHYNTRHGGGGARFMLEVARVRPRARRVLYSSSMSAAHEALSFAHSFLRRPWRPGALLESLRGQDGGAATGASG